jgi:predicted methyltransferase
MFRLRFLIGSSLLLSCSAGGSAPPSAVEPSAAGEPAAAPATPPGSAAPTAPVAPATSPEAQKKLDEQKQLDADRARMLADHETELGRWTPDLRAGAKALAERAYPSGRAAVQAALSSPHRRPGNAARDVHRHPLQTLEFFGLTPTLTVLEYGPGEGWYTEILAPSLAKRGKLIVTTADPNGPKDQRSTFYGERLKLFLETAPELYGQVESITVDPKSPDLKLEGSVDLALVIRGLHGMQNSGVLAAWLAEIHAALKPNGTLGIVQHRANPDAVAEDSSKRGYLPEQWVIQRIEAAGFKLVAKSEINRNTKDTKDYPEGVWALPPTYRLKAGEDRAKYAAIGESDRMTLKFRKLTKPQ